MSKAADFRYSDGGKKNGENFQKWIKINSLRFTSHLVMQNGDTMSQRQLTILELLLQWATGNEIN